MCSSVNCTTHLWWLYYACCIQAWKRLWFADVPMVISDTLFTTSSHSLLTTWSKSCSWVLSRPGAPSKYWHYGSHSILTSYKIHSNAQQSWHSCWLPHTSADGWTHMPCWLKNPLDGLWHQYYCKCPLTSSAFQFRWFDLSLLRQTSHACSGMTPCYTKLDDDKDEEFGELLGRTSQAKHGDKSCAEPTVHNGGERRQGLFIQESTRRVSHTVVGWVGTKRTS